MGGEKMKTLEEKKKLHFQRSAFYTLNFTAHILCTIKKDVQRRRKRKGSNEGDKKLKIARS